MELPIIVLSISAIQYRTEAGSLVELESTSTWGWWMGGWMKYKIRPKLSKLGLKLAAGASDIA